MGHLFFVLPSSFQILSILQAQLAHIQWAHGLVKMIDSFSSRSRQTLHLASMSWSVTNLTKAGYFELKKKYKNLF